MRSQRYSTSLFMTRASGTSPDALEMIAPSPWPQPLFTSTSSMSTAHIFRRAHAPWYTLTGAQLWFPARRLRYHLREPYARSWASLAPRGRKSQGLSTKLWTIAHTYQASIEECEPHDEEYSKSNVVLSTTRRMIKDDFTPWILSSARNRASRITKDTDQEVRETSVQVCKCGTR